MPAANTYSPVADLIAQGGRNPGTYRQDKRNAHTDQGRNCHRLGQNCGPEELAVAAVFYQDEGASSARSGAVSEREKVLSKLERYLTIRNRISNGLAVTIIEELIKETEERLAQIENNVADQKALTPTLGEVPE